MATKAAQSFENPLYANSGGSLASDMSGYTFLNPAASTGADSLQKGLADIATLGAAGQRATQFELPPMKKPPAIAYSPSRKELFVNGITFAEDDADMTLQAERLINQPSVGLPTGGDWVPLTPQAYGQLAGSIRNPSLGRLMSANFGIGVDQMQMLAGRGLQLLGAEETGQAIVDRQTGIGLQRGDLQKNAPYVREFSDIDSTRGAIEWLAATVAQQGPNILESVATAAAGFFGGTAASGGNPVVGAGAALAGLAGKTAFKQGVMAALKKRAAGEVLDAAETKLLREAAGITGATIANVANNYATGAADIYGEFREQGAGADSTNARLAALSGAVPYAILESVPEFLLASRLFGKGGLSATGGATAMQDIQGSNFLTTTAKRGGELLKRGAKGAVVGGTSEGATELGQEALLVGLTGQDFSSQDVQKRLLESFAAGFGVGGTIGFGVNLRKGPIGRQETDILQGNQQVPPPTSDSTQAVPVGGPTPSGGMGARPDFVAGAEGVRASRPGDRIYAGEVQPNQFGGAQGVLDLGGIPVAEAKARSMQGNVQPQRVWDVTTQSWREVSPQEQAAQIGPVDMRPDPNQMALQFAPPAPGGVGFTDQAAPVVNPIMQQQMNLAQSRQAQERLQAEQAAQREADLTRMNNIAQAQRQLEIAQQAILQEQQRAAQQQATQQQLPTKPLPVRAPQQLELFSRREAPRPSRAEGIRRGVGTQVPEQAGTPVTPRVDLRTSPQMALFTQQGQPTVAALRSAAKPTPVATPTVEAGATQAPPTGKPVTAVTSAKAVERLKKARGPVVTVGSLQFEDGSSYTGEMVNEMPKGKGTFVYPDGSVYTGMVKTDNDGAIVFDGQGRFEDADGTVMEGQFKNGEFQGEPNAPQERKQQQGRQPKRQQDNAGVQGGRQTGQQPTTQEQGGGTQAGGRSQPLKRGTKQTQEAVTTTAPTEPTEPTPPKGGKALKKAAPKKETPAKGKAAPKAAPLQKGPSGLAAMVGQLMGTAKQPEVVAGETAPKKRTGAYEMSAETKAANEELDLSIETVETTKSPAAYAEALYTIVETYATTSNKKSYLYRTSQSFLASGAVPKSDYMQALREVAMDMESISKTSNLYGLLAEVGLLNDVNIQKLIRGNVAVVSQDAVSGATVAKTNEEVSAEQQLANLINQQVYKPTYQSKDALVKKMEALYAKVEDDMFIVGTRGTIADFFTADGKAIVTRAPGSNFFLPNTTTEGEMSVEEFTKRENAARAEMQALEDEEAQSTLDDIQYDPLLDGRIGSNPIKDDDWRAYRANGKPLMPMKVGPLRLFVARAISKYAKKPNVYVFANMADMKRQNPGLFETAAKARKAGDIEAVNAAGMAWGNNVVLFADMIHSEEHARFILAHETLGHVGFRGLFSNAALDKILQLVADSDPDLRAAAEVYANGQGIPFLEAVEEVLADRAAALDNNTILRFWNWLKDQLNKLGFAFNDDAARYLISLSRKYVREGVGRSEVNTSGLFKEIADTPNDQSQVEVLRFAQSMAQAKAFFAQNHANRDFAIYGGIERAMRDIVSASQKGAELAKQGKGFAVNARNLVQKTLDGIQTQDNMARKSEGYFKIFRYLQDLAARQTQLKTKYSNMTALAHEAKFMGFGQGMTREETLRAGDLMAYATLLKMNQVSDKQLEKAPNIVFYDPNLEPTPKINPEGFQQLQKLGRVTPEQFRAGFQVQQGTEERPMTAERRAELEAMRDAEIAKLEAAKQKVIKRLQLKLSEAQDEEAKLKGQYLIKQAEGTYDRNIENAKRAYARDIAAKTYEAPKMQPAPEWFKDVDGTLIENDDGTVTYTGNSIEYKVYLQFFEAISNSAADVLIGKYLGAIHEQSRAITSGVGEAFRGSPLTAQERKFIEDVVEQYDDMRLKDSEYVDNRFKMSDASEEDANEWLEKKFGRAFYSDLALADLTKMIKGYTPTEVETLVRGMRKKLAVKVNPDIDNVNNSSIWALIRQVEERAMFAATINDDQFYAKRTIAGSYVPLTREGEWQVRIQAYQTINGQEVPVKLKQGQQDSVFYGKVANEKDARELAAELATTFEGEFEMRLAERGADGGNIVANVKLKPIISVAEQTPALVDILHYDEVMYSLSRLGIRLTPETREVLVQKVTAQNTRARANLKRAGAPGWDKDVVKSASAYLEQQAYTAANKEFRHQFDEVLENPENWMPTAQSVEELRQKWEAATGEAKAIAGREYFQKKFYYDNAVQNVDGQRIERGNWYKERAKSLLDWKNSTGDIIHADDIWTNNEWSVAARTWAALAQLGGSIATGVTQVLSLPTNSWAYLASFNPKNGFGVGLGAGRAATLLFEYGRKAGNFRYADLAFIEGQIAELQKSGAKANKDGLTFAELNFLKTMTEEQRLDAAQFNALTGTSRGRKITGNPTAQKFIQVWMFPFSYSEQFNRRTTLLAAYRGEYDRQIASGKNANEADIAAREVASRAVDATQGDYAQYNRPAFFRGGLQSFVYMYKQYPILMVQLLKNMNYEGRIIMLGSLLLLSGLRGIPGADDILDIVDGICQRLGLKIGSVEKEFARILRDTLGAEMAETITPIAMRGLLDQFTGLAFSNRMGLGDIIPGTALLKPSASKDEMLREVINIAGAPTAFLTGSFEYVFNTMPAVATGRKGFGSLLRDSPVRAVKNLGDALKFYDTGAIVDSKGYVVAQNASTWEILGKAMGWYPSRAQAQMDWMMADSQEQAYMSMIKTEAVRQAVAARLSNDPEAEKSIKEYIKDWNESVKGTRLEIRTFDKSVSQAYREAKKPLALRSLKSSAKGGRAEAKEMLRIYGVDEEVLNGIPD